MNSGLKTSVPSRAWIEGNTGERMENWEIEIVRSSRKTMSLQIKPDGSIVVRAPKRLPEREIYRFVQEKADWIEKHMAKVQQANEAGELSPLSAAEIQTLAQQALQVIPPRVQYYAARMGVTYGRITVRNQTTRWGSCSSQGNLNFNCLLMLAPVEILDYVIVHELAHRKQMNHSAAFWAEVEAVFPDYRQRVKWLKTNGATLLARMRSGREWQ